MPVRHMAIYPHRRVSDAAGLFSDSYSKVPHPVQTGILHVSGIRRRNGPAWPWPGSSCFKSHRCAASFRAMPAGDGPLSGDKICHTYSIIRNIVMQKTACDDCTAYCNSAVRHGTILNCREQYSPCMTKQLAPDKQLPERKLKEHVLPEKNIVIHYEIPHNSRASVQNSLCSTCTTYATILTFFLKSSNLSADCCTILAYTPCFFEIHPILHNEG